MRKGLFVLSMDHKTNELNVITEGAAIVRTGDQLHLVAGPCSFESAPGIRKALWMLRDTRWFTFHKNPDDIRDIPTLEAMLARKTDAQKAHEKYLACNAESEKLDAGTI